MKLSELKPANPDTTAFAEYWLSLPRENGLVPHRRDFDPTAIPRLLPRLIMHEVIDRKRLHLRLVGTKLVERYGMDITGRDYLDFVPDDRKESAITAMNAAIDRPAGMLVGMNIKTTEGRVYRAESLGLPLTQGADRPPLYIFHSAEAENYGYMFERDGALKHFGVSERVFLDIGAGVPAPIEGERKITVDQNLRKPG